MSANAVVLEAVVLEECVETYQESLTDRMGRGRLPLGEALGYATRIAASLRDLHSQRLVYGAVSSQLILIGPSGATLRSSGGLTHLGDGRRDVRAFGAVLAEMARRLDGPEDLCAEFNSIAVCCQDDTTEMQQVHISLRLLGLRRTTAVSRRPVRMKPATSPNTAAAEPALADPALAGPAFADKIRLRLHLSLHWRPLASLAVFAFGGK